jgi:hypothetical protein
MVVVAAGFVGNAQAQGVWEAEPSERDFSCRSVSLRIDDTLLALKRKNIRQLGEKGVFQQYRSKEAHSLSKGAIQ